MHKLIFISKCNTIIISDRENFKHIFKITERVEQRNWYTTIVLVENNTPHGSKHTLPRY